MDSRLLKTGMIRYFAGVVLMGVLLFLPAGSLSWFNGWLLMGVLFVPMLGAGIVMYLKAPDLLRSRLSMNETEKEQKQVIGLSGLMFICAFVLAGLNERFRWTSIPEWTVYAACIIFLAGYLLFAEVLKENRYLSRVVEVQEGQQVVDTGLYGIVRHPMYSATVLLFLSMPLILNCWPSFVIMLGYLPIIDQRIRNEEEVLEEGLPGYREYKAKVKYRLIPFIW
jgi:protein-S-isoprenylcysteine O-methyltransferase Ste14